MESELRKSTLARLARLDDDQISLLNVIIDSFEQPIRSGRLRNSDVISEQFLVAFGNLLKLHHSLSTDYLDKSRFEAAIEKIYRATGRSADRPANRCNPGHDITVDGVPWSLKTQGDRQIKADFLHISKFMELGRGQWGTDERDLIGLRKQFFEHMRSYERILQLRYFGKSSLASTDATHRYELVEIPKALLLEAQTGVLEMIHSSRQIPRPGYCTVRDRNNEIKFKLYFDGGTERKLQIKHLRKDLCIVHATWEF